MNQKEVEAAGREEYALWRNSKDRVNSIYDFMASNANAHIDRLDTAVTSGDPEDMLDVFGPGGGIAGVTAKGVGKGFWDWITAKNSPILKKHTGRTDEEQVTRLTKKEHLQTQTDLNKRVLARIRYDAYLKRNPITNKKIPKHPGSLAYQLGYRDLALIKKKFEPFIKNTGRKNRPIFSAEERAARKSASRQKDRADKIQRTPNWLTNKELHEIEDMYLLRNKINKATGIDHHVDHIIPLRGKNISGLHVPNNLQVIKASENLFKNNKINLKDIDKISKEAYERTVQQREFLKSLKGKIK